MHAWIWILMLLKISISGCVRNVRKAVQVSFFIQCTMTLAGIQNAHGEKKDAAKGSKFPYICSEYLCSACCEYVCMMEMSACVGDFTRGFRTRRVVWRSIIDTLLGIEYKQSFLPLQFWESPKATLCVLITAEC